MPDPGRRALALEYAHRLRAEAAALEKSVAGLKADAEAVERNHGVAWCHLCGRYDCAH